MDNGKNQIGTKPIAQEGELMSAEEEDQFLLGVFKLIEANPDLEVALSKL
jgi:hypothetical protein